MKSLNIKPRFQVIKIFLLNTKIEINKKPRLPSESVGVKIYLQSKIKKHVFVFDLLEQSEVTPKRMKNLCEKMRSVKFLVHRFLKKF